MGFYSCEIDCKCFEITNWSHKLMSFHTGHNNMLMVFFYSSCLLFEISCACEKLRNYVEKLHANSIDLINIEIMEVHY
jgi:hypothetical protein